MPHPGEPQITDIFVSRAVQRRHECVCGFNSDLLVHHSINQQ